MKKLHTFVVCAYKEEPFLEECVKSLTKQTLKSDIIISTSTPNDFIKNIAKKYNAKLAINTKTKGHINDFYFAYDQAKTKYVTLCHQDDVYYENYALQVVKKMEKAKKPIIAFTNYYELRDGHTKKFNLLLMVKRIMNFPFLFLGKFKKIRLFILSLGNTICCPSVTYNKELVSYPIKRSDLKSNIDWDTYLDFATFKGEFVYLTKPLMAHRIHNDSLTTRVLNNNVMNEENYMIFRRFWPEKIAKVLTKIYDTSEKNNNFKKEESSNMMKYLIVVLYLVLTVSGLILYKYGANKSFEVSFSNSIFNMKISIISIIGLVCYLCSFLLYMFIIPRFNISYIMPLTSAISYIGIFVLSILVLGEQISVNGIVGSIIILVGIVVMNFFK